MANSIYKSDNYIIVEKDAKVYEYAINKTVYTQNDEGGIEKIEVIESNVSSRASGRTTILISEVTAGEWLDAPTGNPYTVASLVTFLRQNTGFNPTAGGSVVDGGLIVGQIPRWNGSKYTPSEDKNLGDTNLISSDVIRTFSTSGNTTGNQINFQNDIGQPILKMNGAGQIWSYGKGFQLGNTGFGDGTFNNMVSGNGNTAFGTLSSPNLNAGFDNVSMGRASMFGLTNGSRNTGIGYFSLARNSTGVNNTAVGMLSADSAVTTILTSVSNGVFIGHDTRALVNGSNNEIVIGAQAIGNGSNTATIGNASTVATYLKGKLNIGTIPTSPTGLNVGDVWSNLGILTIIL